MSYSEVAALIRASHGNQGFSWDRDLTDLEHLTVLSWHIKRGTFDAVTTPHIRQQLENTSFPSECYQEQHI